MVNVRKDPGHHLKNNEQFLELGRNTLEEKIPFLVDIGNHMQERLLSGESVLADNCPPRSAAPFNGGSGSTFKDINQLILAQQAKDNAYKSNVWLTLTQTGNLQGHIKPGERPTVVQFVVWKNADKTDRTNPLYSNYGVFNLDQTRGIDPRMLKKPPEATKVDQQAMAYIFKGTAPRNSGEEIGNWMAAAHFGIQLEPGKGVNIQTLTDDLEVNHALGNHSHIFRLANYGQGQLNVLAKTLNNFKERVMEAALIAPKGLLPEHPKQTQPIAKYKKPTAKPRAAAPDS
jgi:hypothetical protein